MFNIDLVTATAQEAVDKLIAQIKEDDFDRDFIAEFKPGVEFKVFIQPDQINCAIISSTLREWLDGFFVSGDGEPSAFEKEFYKSANDFSLQHPLFSDVDHSDTHMWIIDEVDDHSPEAVFYAYVELATDYESPDYELLEKVMKSVYGLLIITHTWLEMKRGNVAEGQPVVVS